MKSNEALRSVPQSGIPALKPSRNDMAGRLQVAIDQAAVVEGQRAMFNLLQSEVERSRLALVNVGVSVPELPQVADLKKALNQLTEALSKIANQELPSAAVAADIARAAISSIQAPPVTPAA